MLNYVITEPAMGAKYKPGYTPYTDTTQRASNQNKATKSTSFGGSSMGMMIVIILILVVLSASVVVQVMTYINTDNSPTTCPCAWASKTELFFPYGEKNGDWTNVDSTVMYYVDTSIVYKVLGIVDGSSNVVIKMVSDKGNIVYGLYDPIKGKVSKDVYCKFGGILTADLDDPGDGLEMLHRKASTSDKAMFDCLYPNLKIKEAYLFTWVKATKANGTTEVGTFQIAILFGENSATYIVRNYGDDLGDLTGETEPFRIQSSTARLGSALTSTDVKGKRQAFILSEPSFGKLPVTADEQENGPCPA